MGAHSRSQLCFSWGRLHLFPFMQEKHFIWTLCNLLLGNTGHSWFHQMMNQWVPLLLHTSYSKFLGGFLDNNLGSKKIFAMTALDTAILFFCKKCLKHCICLLTSLSIKWKPSLLLLYKIIKSPTTYRFLFWNSGVNISWNSPLTPPHTNTPHCVI